MAPTIVEETRETTVIDCLEQYGETAKQDQHDIGETNTD